MHEETYPSATEILGWSIVGACAFLATSGLVLNNTFATIPIAAWIIVLAGCVSAVVNFVAFMYSFPDERQRDHDLNRRFDWAHVLCVLLSVAAIVLAV